MPTAWQQLTCALGTSLKAARRHGHGHLRRAHRLVRRRGTGNLQLPRLPRALAARLRQRRRQPLKSYTNGVRARGRACSLTAGGHAPLVPVPTWLTMEASAWPLSRRSAISANCSPTLKQPGMAKLATCPSHPCSQARRNSLPRPAWHLGYLLPLPSLPVARLAAPSSAAAAQVATHKLQLNKGNEARRQGRRTRARPLQA